MTRSPLIEVRELAGLPPGSVTLLDVRWQLGGPAMYDDYLRGHLPGAVYVDLATDLADPPGDRGRHPLPEPGRFEETMRRSGVRNGKPVVVYDGGSSMSAARAWWLLRYHGHRDVRVLDGGFDAWVEAGGTVERGESDRSARGDFVSDPGQMPVVEADQVLDVARTGVLIDARSGERYRGESEPIDPVAGHIPGAVNLPSTENLTADGRFRTAEELRAEYQAAGSHAGVVGAYCGSGVTAAQTVLVLDLLGVPAALYPGSWSEWVTDPARPVATATASDPNYESKPETS